MEGIIRENCHLFSSQGRPPPRSNASLLRVFPTGPLNFPRPTVRPGDSQGSFWALCIFALLRNTSALLSLFAKQSFRLSDSFQTFTEAARCAVRVCVPFTFYLCFWRESILVQLGLQHLMTSYIYLKLRFKDFSRTLLDFFYRFAVKSIPVH